MTTLALSKVLEESLKATSENIKYARRDQKIIKKNSLGVSTFRTLIAEQIKVLKAQRHAIDLAGGGAKASKLQLSINYLRSVLNELTEELVMIKLQSKECAGYLAEQQTRVKDIDAHWEQAKLNEVETTEQA